MNCVNHPDQDAPYQCYRCQSAICVDCETKMSGRSICPVCMAQIRAHLAQRYESETRHVNYCAGALAGLLMAAGGAFAWSQVVVMTDSQLAAAAVVLGGAVGYAVMLGAGEKRGYSLQQMAAVLALVAGVLAYLLIFVRSQGVVYAFPEYLASLAPLDWLYLVLGVLWAYWVPHVRSLPEQPKK
ncbi:MAG: hypothetical protein MUQ26_04490 [Armatimonadetes bacterium]|nr:hypothetical protein [Armatimonadota bacterium]